MDSSSGVLEETYLVLSAEEQAKIDKIKNLVDAADLNTIIQYGTGVQSRISDFTDKVLSEVRTKDTGHVGKALADLMVKVKDLHLDAFSDEKKGFLSKIPLIGSLIDGTRRFASKYQSVSTNILQIIEALERAKTQLIHDVKMLDSFYDAVIGYFKDINLYILAGEMKHQDLQATVLPGLKAQAEASGDQLEIQKYQDTAQFVSRLEKRIHDLKLSRAIALQTAPQIRLIQKNNQELAEKIQSSILNTIPLWKNQIIMAISLLKQRQIIDLQHQVSETTKTLLEKNAEMLREGSLEIALESEKGIVDILTLKKVNAELITTIEETLKIHGEGKSRRKQAEEELVKLEQELKTRMLQIKSSLQDSL